MRQPRLQKTGTESFYGDYLYNQIVPQEHFLRKLRELVPWQHYTYRLLRYYRGQGKVGRPPIDPAIVFKMLLLSYLYNISERQTEEFCNLNLAAKYFLGLAIDEQAPDHSTLTAFKQRLPENGKLKAYERLLGRVIADAREAGITFGSLELIDSTHSIADENTAKDDKDAEEGDEPRDPDARWGCKGSYPVTDEEERQHTRRQYFYGYKGHVSMNSAAQMITSLIPSAGNAHDGHYLTALIARDLAQGLPVGSCAAGRGYDDTENHYWLEQHGIQNAIHLYRYRIHKKDRDREVWVALKAEPRHSTSLAQRYQIERSSGRPRCITGWRGIAIWGGSATACRRT